MLLAKNHIKLTKGPTAFLVHVLHRAIEDLEREGMTLATLTFDEFMAANDALTHRGWYPLHPHYCHPEFRGLAITDIGMTRILATAVSRPLDLDGRSVGQAFEDLHFAYPQGVPLTAKDRFENIPIAAYGLKGNGAYHGGYWIDPDARHGSRLTQNLPSPLLSYLTRSLSAWVVGTDDPDFFFGIVIDDLLKGRDRNRSAVDRYGWRYAAPGPNWVKHYPDADLPVNCLWIDRAGILEVLDATPWVSGRTAWEHPLAPTVSRTKTSEPKTADAKTPGAKTPGAKAA